MPAGTVVMSWNSPQFAQPILVAGNGHVLYLFTPDDATGTNTCNCPQQWPPLTTKSGAPKAQGAAKQGLLGVSNGQVTYNGHPLYFYYLDSKPDQPNGQGVNEVWYVVTVSGNACTSATCM